jgi:putative aminopeptidase FrvX
LNVELLRKLVEATGVSGREEALREIVRQEMKPHVDEIRTDALGNVVCVKRGAGNRKLMVAAHMDEIGFFVKFIDDKGFIRVQPVGGFDPRQLFAQRVKVTTRGGTLPGVLTYGSKPVHMLTEEERKAPPKIDNFFIDLGMGKEQVQEKVQVGDMVTMDRGMTECGETFVCKAMDDRAGLYAMLEAVKAAGKHEADLYAVATVQEEVGVRGAQTSAYGIEPDACVALDTTLANDFPGPSEQDSVSKLGEGVAIKIMDSLSISHPKMVEHFRSLADANGIPYQMEILPRGGTDAGAMQRARAGAPSITLSIPTRYIHTVNEMVHKKDLQACVDLLAAYIREAHRGEYAL